ncbi:hypothetical protein D3C72_2003890 [compost metagenome]
MSNSAAVPTVVTGADWLGYVPAAISKGIRSLLLAVNDLIAAGSRGSSFNCAWVSASRNGVAGTPMT